MNSRLVARVAVVLSVLSGVTGSGQNVGKLDVSEGPTPFIRFVHTRVDDVPGFEFAEFWIFPKSGSATRPIKARYARSYLEARGYFYPESGKLTIPIFGLYAGRPNHVLINLAFGGRFHPIKLTITTPAYDGGTYSHPTVIQPLLPGTTLSYDFILLKGYADPITPIIIDTDAEIRWVGTAGVRTQNCMLFDNAFYLTSGTTLLRTEFDGVTTPVADYSGIGVTGFHHNIDPGREGMILDVDTAPAGSICQKTTIQALDRKDPVLPLSPGRAERHGFEYFRHGTLSLYAAFNTKTGEVLGKTAARHTSAEFVAFLSDIVVNQPRGKEIHVIADNLSAHKTGQVNDFLDRHPKVHLHFTPTYSSWLNQIELWFAKIERDVIARGVFTSLADLRRKLMKYIRHYNKAPKTVKWRYFDPTRRITPSSAVTAH